MSIASEIQRLQTSKANIKAQVNIDVDDINEGTDFIDEETLDDYADLIEDMQEAYKQYIPINSTSDTQIDAPKGGAIIGKTIKGNTSQNGTPTPDAPIEVNNVTGEQVVRVCGKNLFDKDKERENYFYNATGVRELSNDTTFINQEYDNIDFSSITISFSGKNGVPYVRVCEYNSSGTFIARTLLDTNNQLLNLNSNTKKVIFCVNGKDTSNSSYFENLQIEKRKSSNDTRTISR